MFFFERLETFSCIFVFLRGYIERGKHAIWAFVCSVRQRCSNKSWIIVNLNLGFAHEPGIIIRNNCWILSTLKLLYVVYVLRSIFHSSTERRDNKKLPGTSFFHISIKHTLSRGPNIVSLKHPGPKFRRREGPPAVEPSSYCCMLADGLVLSSCQR